MPGKGILHKPVICTILFKLGKWPKAKPNLTLHTLLGMERMDGRLISGMHSGHFVDKGDGEATSGDISISVSHFTDNFTSVI